MKTKMLCLNLNGEYFDHVATRIKMYEYRLCTDYWRKRLLGRHYDGIVIKRGYPKRGEAGKTITRPWRGYEIQTICHPHFGPDRVEVFAIRVNKDLDIVQFNNLIASVRKELD